MRSRGVGAASSTYHAAWKGTTRKHVARPLRLVWHRSALYLLACLGEHQRITTLAVHRIRDLEVTDETFAAPRVDVDAHVAKAFGIFVSDHEEDVEIVFDAEIAWKVEERTFHPAERKERSPDGTLRYRVRSSAQWEIIPWVQSFGALAELVAPASWRASLTRTSTRCARSTRSESPCTRRKMRASSTRCGRSCEDRFVGAGRGARADREGRADRRRRRRARGRAS